MKTKPYFPFRSEMVKENWEELIYSEAISRDDESEQYATFDGSENNQIILGGEILRLHTYATFA